MLKEKSEINIEEKVFQAWSEIEKAFDTASEKSTEIQQKLAELKEKFHPDKIEPCKKGLAGEAIQGELFSFQSNLKRRDKKIIQELLSSSIFQDYSIYLSETDR